MNETLGRRYKSQDHSVMAEGTQDYKDVPEFVEAKDARDEIGSFKNVDDSPNREEHTPYQKPDYGTSRNS